MVQFPGQSPILGRLPTIDQVCVRLEQTAAERRALRTLLKALKQANLVPAIAEEQKQPQAGTPAASGNVL